MHICLFDIDGTLLNSGGAGKAAMDAALTEEFGVASLTDQVSFNGRTDRAIAKDLLRLHGMEETPEIWQRFLSRYLGLLPVCLAELNGRIMPGITALLEQLADRSEIVLGLLTGNLRDGARLKLGHYGLYDYFAFGGFGDHHLDRDDVAREALAEAERHVNAPIDLDRFWVIGDTPLDVSCARAIGARVAAVATGWCTLEELADSQPDLLLKDLSDPAPLLALLGCERREGQL